MLRLAESTDPRCNLRGCENSPPILSPRAGHIACIPRIRLIALSEWLKSTKPSGVRVAIRLYLRDDRAKATLLSSNSICPSTHNLSAPTRYSSIFVKQLCSFSTLSQAFYHTASQKLSQQCRIRFQEIFGTWRIRRILQDQCIL